MRRMRGRGERASVYSKKLMFKQAEGSVPKHLSFIFSLGGRGNFQQTVAVQMAKHIGPKAGAIQFSLWLGQKKKITTTTTEPPQLIYCAMFH